MQSRALLRQVGDPGTLHVLVIEDAHWADEASIDLLRFLGRRIRNAPVLLLVTYRDEGLSATDPLRVALGDLATQRSVRRVSLPPLSEDAVALLAGGSGLDPVELYRLTGGNPFYVSEAVQAGTSEMPASARDAVLARAARLGRPAREVLDVAALIGGRVELAVLERAVDCAGFTVDVAVDELQLAADWEGAARHWADLGCPYEAGLALLGSTRESLLREALRIFAGLGAMATVRVTQQKMRRLGIRSIPAGPRPATRAHPLGLTRREQEVLELLSAGLTNAEIAGKLFISAKTVDHHVSAVLAKLGVPSRGAAAKWAVKLGSAAV